MTLLTQEITQIGVINAVNKMNKIEIPSIPNLNFIKPLIQLTSSTNWKFATVLSNEYHRNNTIKKFTKLVKRETYIAPLFIWLLSLRVKNTKNAPIKGKNVTDDNIGTVSYTHLTLPTIYTV